MNARKKYSKEFKLDAVSLVIDQNYTRTEASKNLGISPMNYEKQLLEVKIAAYCLKRYRVQNKEFWAV